MSNYSDKPTSVRVDFFRSTGKWYTTEAVLFDDKTYRTVSIHDAFNDALRKHLCGRLRGCWAVCLEPYHEQEHPLMVKVP